MSHESSNRGVLPLLLGTVLVAALLAACSGQQATSSPTPSGLTSIEPTATASASAGESATPTASPAPTATPTPTALPKVEIGLKTVVSGLSHPIGLANAGDDRLFVIQQTGQIVIVKNGVKSGTFLNIAGRISTNHSERGLLGLAFNPDYAVNGLFYVRYTTPAGDVRISEFKRGSSPDVADPASERIIITIPHPNFGNHNGGMIAFGPDGYLWIGTGDGGSGGDPNNNGQNLNVLLGKMLRIDVNQPSGGKNYTIPADNPFAGQSGKRGEIWAYGLRNPYMFSFDRQTGDLWIADVGQNLWEEVDRATFAGGLGRGANYGWSVMEGRHCYKPSSGCKTSGKVLPLAEYNHGSGDSVGCSIIGGSVYRGSLHPELTGRYFFGDYCTGNIWDVAAAGPSTQSPQYLLDSGVWIMGWGEGADGEIYLAAKNGKIYQLT
jgi:glucose/arabinose dehydrogenase